MNNTESFDFFASCAKGIEQLLEKELIALGATNTKTTVAGVSFSGDSGRPQLEIAYKACLWSRCASRVLMPLLYCDDDADTLYQHVNSFAWHQHMTADNNLWINFVQGAPSNNSSNNSNRNPINHSRFGAQRIKDGICDYFVDSDNRRPNVDSDETDITLHARSYRGGITLSLDLSGSSLHRRGYRDEQGEAPLRETLAAALLYRAGWATDLNNPRPLIDPMCGSGTLLIEAAMMALDKAPGLERYHFGFSAWQQHQSQLWQQLVDDANQRYQLACKKLLDETDASWAFFGFDSDHRQIERARHNIQRAGLSNVIELAQADIKQHNNLAQRVQQYPSQGLCITNPPYGERLGEHEQLMPLYKQLGQFLKQLIGWQAAVIVSDKTLGKAISIHSHKNYKVYNGAIECQLLLFNLEPEQFIDSERKQQLSPESQMVINRLKKNKAHLKNWLKKQSVSCYRLYDADMPEYAAAIDIYDQQLLLQLYQAPKTIEKHKAAFRERQLTRAVDEFAKQQGIKPENIHLRSRQQQKGKSQYQPKGKASRDANVDNRKNIYNTVDDNLDYAVQDYYVVEENGILFNVNFERYLDTGLFLDHRPLRRRLLAESAGKHVLNLFSYTSSLSVACACGGSASTLSVDMSNTYLRWAEENFELNKQPCYFNKRSLDHDTQLNTNHLLKTDCIAWLQQQYLSNYPLQFDIIVLDPPTFSNSKTMAQSLDIQRDHDNLIRLIMPMLTNDGVLYFSTNHRRFKLDENVQTHFNCTDITSESLDKDYQLSQHSKRIHQLWEIQHQH